MEQPKDINDLTDDARFHVIRNLDYPSISNLCSTNRIFRQFCASFEGDIYRYLLQRDYGISNPRDTSKNLYLQARATQDLTLRRLREAGITIFADMLELECLVKPTGRIHQLFARLDNQVIMAPLDAAIQEYVRSVIYGSEDYFYKQFNTMFLENHVGVYNPANQRFSNYNGITFLVPAPGGLLVGLGNVNTIQLFSVSRPILTQEQDDLIYGYFDDHREADTMNPWG